MGNPAPEDYSNESHVFLGQNVTCPEIRGYTHKKIVSYRHFLLAAPRFGVIVPTTGAQVRSGCHFGKVRGRPNTVRDLSGKRLLGNYTMTVNVGKLLAAAVVGMCAVGFGQSAKAASVLFTFADATVNFTPVSGGIDITITNTQSGTIVKSQAIASLDFSVSGISTPTAFTKLTGSEFDPVAGASWTLASGTPFSHTSSDPPINSIDHWGFNTSGSAVILHTAASPVPGAGNPEHMIIPSAGTAGSGGSLNNGNFGHFIIGPADFFLTVPGITTSTVLTASNFTGVTLGFGTGPDTYETGSPPGTPRTPVPVPAAAWTGMALLAGLGAVAKYRKRLSR